MCGKRSTGRVGPVFLYTSPFVFFFFLLDDETDKHGKRKFSLLIGARIFGKASFPPKKKKSGKHPKERKCPRIEECLLHFF